MRPFNDDGDNDDSDDDDEDNDEGADPSLKSYNVKREATKEVIDALNARRTETIGLKSGNCSFISTKCHQLPPMTDHAANAGEWASEESTFFSFEKKKTSTAGVHQMRLPHRHSFYHFLAYQLTTFHLIKPPYSSFENKWGRTGGRTDTTAFRDA